MTFSFSLCGLHSEYQKKRRALCFEGFEDTAYSSLAVLEPPCCLFSPLVILYVKYQHSSISVYKGNQV